MNEYDLRSNHSQNPINFEPKIERLRYPGQIDDGSLVFALYGAGEFLPAIKWGCVEDGEKLHGLAFLCPVDTNYQYPVSKICDHGHWALVVKSEWSLRIPVDRSDFREGESSDLRRSGIMIGDSTYLRTPLLDLYGRSPRWHLVDLRTGVSKLEHERGLLAIDGWDLYIGDTKINKASWSPSISA